MLAVKENRNEESNPLTFLQRWETIDTRTTCFSVFFNWAVPRAPCTNKLMPSLNFSQQPGHSPPTFTGVTAAAIALNLRTPFEPAGLHVYWNRNKNKKFKKLKVIYSKIRSRTKRKKETRLSCRPNFPYCWFAKPAERFMVPTPTADDRRTPTRPNLLQPPTVERKKMAREKKLYRRFELRNTIILKKKKKFTSSEKMSGPEWAVKKKWPRPHFR